MTLDKASRAWTKIGKTGSKIFLKAYELSIFCAGSRLIAILFLWLFTRNNHLYRKHTSQRIEPRE